ncbi:MAG: amino acid adenylation domain-containing protein, partial [Pelobacteraceae bacterium]
LAEREWYETSPGQRRLWMLQRMAPGSSAYNMPLALKLEGAIDPAALRKSFADLALRHEALRTLFPEQDGLPVQVILPEAGDLLASVDLQGQATSWEQALNQARQLAATPLDLATGPLFRAHFYQTGENEGLLLVVMHHIIGDGWSWGILLRELARSYRRHTEGGTAVAAPLPVQYKEWAHHQNRALAAGALDRMRQYWHDALSEPAVPLALPTDLPRAALRHDGGASVQVALPPATVARLGELARSQDATLFMVLLALLKTLLHRLGGQEQITVGIPVAGRPLQQIEEVVGFFVNTLALRSRITPDAPFTRLLTQVRRTALDGYENQLYPFDALVGELALPRDTGHAPLFDVMMVSQEEVEGLPGFHNLQVSPIPLEAGTSRFDLTFNFIPDGGALTLELEYATDLFYPETARRIAHRFLTLAGAVAVAPHTPLSRLELLPEEEQAALRACSSGAVRPWPQGKSMVELFRDQAALSPAAVAVVAADRTLTYHQLDQLSGALALQLQTCHALEPEEAVGVMTGRNSLLPVALLGVMKGGGVYLPIDPDQPESRIRHIINDSALRTILVDDETSAQVAIYADTVRVIDVATLMRGTDAGTLQNRPAPSSAAYIIYTSGSTGLPKGVLVEHGGFVNMILDQIRTFGITPEDRCLLFSSFSFDGAMSEIFLALHSGARLVIARRDRIADPELFSRLLEETGTTVATLPPVYLNALRATGASLDPLRVIITAGEAAIAADAVHYARRKTLFNAYGPTEASVCSAIHRVDPLRPYHGSIPIGAPMANSELLLLDDQMQPVPFGVAGEICVAGPGVARGYLNNPELTATVFVPHPFTSGERLYRTGDLGRRLIDGTIEFLGRRDGQVKVRGFRTECGEVERALLNHPAVGGAVVVARGEGGARELVAFLLPKGELDRGSLKADLARQLPPFMLPARFVALEAFPQNSNGKVDRRRLAVMNITQELTAGSKEPPVTAMEKRLAALWEQILGRKGISRHDSFFEIGGQSIAAIRVAAAIHQELGIQLPLPALFQHASLYELALECERTAAFAGGYREERHLLLKQGDKARIFAFPPINGYPVAYSRLAELLDDVSFHGFTFIESDDRLRRYCELIEQLQPTGPLTLFGYSSGGNLAFEMAKELERNGRTVSDMILLDSWKRLPNAPVTENVQDWADGYSPDPALFGNLAELMESPHIRETVFGKLRRYLAYTESLTTQGTIRGTIHLLRAGDSTDLEGLSQEWHVHTEAGCIVHDGGGSHLAMLKEPWVEENARVINSLLGKFEA